MSGPHPVAHLKAEQAVLAELSNSPVNAVNVRQHVDMIRGPPHGPTPPPGSAYGLRRDHSQCAAEVHQRHPRRLRERAHSAPQPGRPRVPGRCGLGSE